MASRLACVPRRMKVDINLLRPLWTESHHKLAVIARRELDLNRVTTGTVAELENIHPVQIYRPLDSPVGKDY